MRSCFHVLIPFGLALAACDKPRHSGGPVTDDDPSKPQLTRANRPPREALPDKRETQRQSLKTALDIESPEAREKAVAEVAWNALELDPELAREAFGQLPADSVERIRLIQHFAMRMAETNLDEALAWAAALGTEKEIAAARGQIALVLADTDPERAANLLSESGIAGRTFDVAAVQVLQRWAAKSPPDAAAWVVMFPAGSAREAGIKAVVSQWAESAPQAAFSWMAALQDEALRREAALAIIEALRDQPQDVRNQWLRHADPKTRAEIEQYEKEAGRNDPPPSE